MRNSTKSILKLLRISLACGLIIGCKPASDDVVYVTFGDQSDRGQYVTELNRLGIKYEQLQDGRIAVYGQNLVTLRNAMEPWYEAQDREANRLLQEQSEKTTGDRPGRPRF